VTRREEIEELFAELWQVPRFAGSRHGFRPNVDCFHTDDPDALTVVVELPGVEPASIRVAAGERALIIAGGRRRPAVAGRVYHQMEVEYGPFHRKVVFGEDVDPGGATATYRRGLLHVRLPIAPKPSPRESVTIEVRTSR